MTTAEFQLTYYSYSRNKGMIGSFLLSLRNSNWEHDVSRNESVSNLVAACAVAAVSQA